MGHTVFVVLTQFAFGVFDVAPLLLPGRAELRSSLAVTDTPGLGWRLGWAAAWNLEMPLIWIPFKRISHKLFLCPSRMLRKSLLKF